MTPAQRLSQHLRDMLIPGVVGVVRRGDSLVVYADPGHAFGLIPDEFEGFQVKLKPGDDPWLANWKPQGTPQ